MRTSLILSCCLAVAFVIAIRPAVTAADDPVFSGPQVGEKLVPFEVLSVYGETAGTKVDPVKLADGAATSGIEIVAEDMAKQSFNLEVRFDNGSSAKVYVGRRGSVPVDMRSPSLRSSLSHFGNRAAVEIVISPTKGARLKHVAVF